MTVNKTKEIFIIIGLCIVIILIIAINVFVFIVGPENKYNDDLRTIKYTLEEDHEIELKYLNSYSLNQVCHTFETEAEYYLIDSELVKLTVINKADINYTLWQDKMVEHRLDDGQLMLGYYDDRTIVALIDDNSEVVYDMATEELLFTYKGE